MHFENNNPTENVQIPSPIASYEDMDAVKKVLPFQPVVPSVLPVGYTLYEITSIHSDMLQLIYTDQNHHTISYRMAKGNEDISGDYNIYPVNQQVLIGSVTVTMRGNDKISNAIWTTDGFTKCAVKPLPLGMGI